MILNGNILQINLDYFNIPLILGYLMIAGVIFSTFIDILRVIFILIFYDNERKVPSLINIKNHYIDAISKCLLFRVDKTADKVANYITKLVGICFWLAVVVLIASTKIIPLHF